MLEGREKGNERVAVGQGQRLVSKRIALPTKQGTRLETNEDVRPTRRANDAWRVGAGRG